MPAFVADYLGHSITDSAILTDRDQWFDPGMGDKLSQRRLTLIDSLELRKSTRQAQAVSAQLGLHPRQNSGVLRIESQVCQLLMLGHKPPLLIVSTTLSSTRIITMFALRLLLSCDTSDSGEAAATPRPTNVVLRKRLRLNSKVRFILNSQLHVGPMPVCDMGPEIVYIPSSQ
jgi:hypothetical protein